MRNHRRSPAVLAGAIAVATLGLSVLAVSLAVGGQAQVAPPPAIEVSNSCAVVNTVTTLTVWGSHIPAGTHTLSSNHGQPSWLPPTQVSPDALGNFTVSIAYTPTDTVPADLVMLDGTPGPSIRAVVPAQCPTSTPPAQPCFAPSAAVALSVSAIVGTADVATARWFLDYPGAGLNPAPFATAPVTSGSSLATLRLGRQVGGLRAGPGIHQITVIAQPTAAAAVLPAVYWTYPITVCSPPAPTTTTGPATTTTTVAPTTTTTAHTSTTTRRFAPTPTTVGPAPVLTINPQVASDGDVTQVHGVGFPPNSAVILEWQPGIGLVVAQTGPDGTFTTPLLVMPHDQTGPRLVQASGFPPTVSAPLLVEPPSASRQWIFRRG